MKTKTSKYQLLEETMYGSRPVKIYRRKDGKMFRLDFISNGIFSAGKLIGGIRRSRRYYKNLPKSIKGW